MTASAPLKVNEWDRILIAVQNVTHMQLILLWSTFDLSFFTLGVDIVALKPVTPLGALKAVSISKKQS